jgi:hypothetical protein
LLGSPHLNALSFSQNLPMVWAFFLLSIWLIWRRARSFRSINSQKRTGYEIFQQAIAPGFSTNTIGFITNASRLYQSTLGRETAQGLIYKFSARIETGVYFGRTFLFSYRSISLPSPHLCRYTGSVSSTLASTFFFPDSYRKVSRHNDSHEILPSTNGPKLILYFPES